MHTYSLKVQERPTGINEREKEKFTDIFTNFTKQLNLGIPSLFKFYVISKTNIHEYLERLYIFVRLDFSACTSTKATD